MCHKRAMRTEGFCGFFFCRGIPTHFNLGGKNEERLEQKGYKITNQHKHCIGLRPVEISAGRRKEGDLYQLPPPVADAQFPSHTMPGSPTRAAFLGAFGGAVGEKGAREVCSMDGNPFPSAEIF